MKKILLFTCFLFLGAKTSAQDHNMAVQSVLNREFAAIRNEIVIFKNSKNDKLIEFLTDKNKVLNSGEYEFDDLANRIGTTDFENLFTDVQVKEFKRQVSNNDFTQNLEFPKHVKPESFKDNLYKKNIEKGLPPDTGIYYYSIGNLVVSKDSQYVLFDYSKGIPGNRTGGIKIYKKELHTDDYKFLGESNAWME